MELSFDRQAAKKERMAFIRSYAAWVKKTPNAEWSEKQAVLIDSLVENARNMPLSARVYLTRVAGRRKARAAVNYENPDDVWKEHTKKRLNRD